MKLGRKVADIAKKIPLVKNYAESLQQKFRDAKRESYLQKLKKIEEESFQTFLNEIKQHIEVMIEKPRFNVIVDQGENKDFLRTIESLSAQIYRNFDVKVIAPTKEMRLPQSSFSLSISKSVQWSPGGSDFLIYLPCGTTLNEFALYEMASVINQYPDLDLVYGDEDTISETGEYSQPFYKPDWSPDYLESFNYIGVPACFRTTVATDCEKAESYYDFVLQFAEKTQRAHHLRKILAHRYKTSILQQSVLESKSNIEAISKRLQRVGRNGVVKTHAEHPGCCESTIDLRGNPLVSVVIPTAGKTISIEERSIDLITNVVEHIRDKSTYKNVEIIIVDNANLNKNQIDKLKQYDCTLVSYTEPVFNVAAKLNLGAEYAKGELLLLLNDDIEVVNASWIERLAQHLDKSHVGAVGARLLYPDGRIQHAGVVTNYGNPDHVRRYAPSNDAGYFYSTCATRNFAAVTGACVMTRTELYRKVGGFSSELAVSFNDVDFCFKVREQGFKIVYEPQAVLTHMESVSRIPSLDMSELIWFTTRWAATLIFDPYYNERYLTISPPTFEPQSNIRYF